MHPFTEDIKVPILSLAFLASHTEAGYSGGGSKALIALS